MSINKLLIKSSFILLVLVSLQSSQAQKSFSTTQAVETNTILNIVDPSEVIGTVVLLADLVSDDDKTLASN